MGATKKDERDFSKNFIVFLVVFALVLNIVGTYVILNGIEQRGNAPVYTGHEPSSGKVKINIIGDDQPPSPEETGKVRLNLLEE